MIRILASVLVVAACGGGGGVSTAACVDLCTEAQAGNCTAITGSCTSFCTALDHVQGAAGCTAQRTAYQSCLEEGVNVCANSCSSEENALAADCQVLISSF